MKFSELRYRVKRVAFYLFGNEWNMGYVVPVSDIPGIPSTSNAFVVTYVRNTWASSNDLMQKIRGTALGDFLDSLEPVLLQFSKQIDEKATKKSSAIVGSNFRTTIKAVRFLERPSWLTQSQSK